MTKNGEDCIAMANDFDIRKENNLSDSELEQKLRPLSFCDFKGQQNIVDNLSIFIKFLFQISLRLSFIFIF